MDVEEQTIEAFVAANRRDRWATGLNNAKRRRKMLDRICHHDDWRSDFTVATLAKGMRDEQIKSLTAQLRRLGAPEDCHVMSESADHDGSSMPLIEALDELSGYGCALIICIPGVLAVHLPESPDPPVILSRHRPHP